MPTVMIGGSLGIRVLSLAVCRRLDTIMGNGFDVVVGDAPGVDLAVQRYLAAHDYPFVTVYSATPVPRHNVGNWPIQMITAPNATTPRAFHTAKDRAMVETAHYGFFIWDGTSQGTRRNIDHCRQLRVPVAVMRA